MGRIRGDLKARTLRFSVRILDAVHQLPNETRAWILGKQLGRAATSIGANVWEADVAQTNPDFAHKMSIARKEANETQYWIQLAYSAGLITLQMSNELEVEAKELGRILGSIVKKTQQHGNRMKESKRGGRN